MLTLIEELPPIFGVLETTNGGADGDYVSLKGVTRAYVLAQLTQAVGHATALAVYQATDVAATGAKVISKVVPIWANEDVAAADGMTRQTDAVNYSVTDDIKNKMVVFEIDPALLDVANDFDCIMLACSDSSQATNFASITYLLDRQDKGDFAPEAITD